MVNSIVDFRGTYDCTVDSKGRIIIPAPLKRQLAPYSDRKFIVKQSGFVSCLELYVMQEWDRHLAILNRLNSFKKKHTDFIRAFLAGNKEVELDSTGRILLTKDLLAFSGISKDVIMASRGNIIEIWDKAAYENKIAETNSNFEELAEEVMPDIDRLLNEQ
jgi:MraZ protein